MIENTTVERTITNENCEADAACDGLLRRQVHYPRHKSSSNCGESFDSKKSKRDDHSIRLYNKVRLLQCRSTEEMGEKVRKIGNIGSTVKEQKSLPD
ncbi:hypothetical protein J6590_050517 [Homalodisca vitripennis]|nr:hypothetical protein J6590_050517 [Homalodisca vitripennis]